MSSDADRIYQMGCEIAVLRAQVTALQESLGVLLRRPPHLSLSEQGAIVIYAEAMAVVLSLSDARTTQAARLYREIALKSWVAARTLTETQGAPFILPDDRRDH